MANLLLKLNKAIYFLFLAIIIPSIILVYLSLVTVKNQKMLMDKDILNRSNIIATAIKEQIEKDFENIEIHIKSDILPLIISKCDYDKVIEKTKILSVIQIFILNKEYNLIYPVVPWTDEVIYEHADISKEFISDFTTIEGKISKGNHEEIIIEYEKLIAKSSNNREKAIILNAMARYYKKIGKQDKAITIYKEIYEGFSEERDINGTLLGTAAYLQCANISLNKNEIKEAIDYYNSLLKSILSGRFKCSKDEVLFYKEVAENTVEKIIQQKLIKNIDLNKYNNTIHQFNNIFFLQQFIKILKEKKLFKEISSENYSYVLFDDKTILGARIILDKNILVFCLNIPQFKDKIILNIKNIIRYTGNIDYEIIDSNNKIFFSSTNTELTNPVIKELLLDRLLEWQIRLNLQESDDLRKSIQIRTYINIGIVILLFVIIATSLYFMFRMFKREKELSTMKTDFVSTVSHEMRTPITAIRMIGEMFQLGTVKDEKVAKDYYDILSGETERITRLINNILDFSRMDSGRKRYNFTSDDISNIVSFTVRAFEKYAENNGYKIGLNIQEQLPKIKIDADAISQVILNLLDNAMKYSPVNKEIKVNMYRKNEHIVIDIIDRGIGIEQNKIDKIFEKFYRSENELTRKTKGAGVGLSIAKHIIDAHKGKIEVKSQRGFGSTFSVIFPIS